MERLSTDGYIWQKATTPAIIMAGPERIVVSSAQLRRNPGLFEGHLVYVPLQRGAAYDIKEAAAHARTRHDPLLSPHGFFRNLPHGKNSAALEFVETFGPLEWADPGPTNLIFSEFWRKHLRYVSIVRLWETRDDAAGLRRSFGELYEVLNEIDFAEGVDNTEIGSMALWPVAPTDTPRRRFPLPWDRESKTCPAWLATTTVREMREGAIGLFHLELNFHIRRRQPRWARCDLWNPAKGVGFELFLSRGSLWDYIWELTGLETAAVSFWRICPACNTLFYPKRSDQFYCKSQEQVLASKRAYARNRRRRERLVRMARERGKQ